MREFYLNADFDWTLRGNASPLQGNDSTYLHELPNHFLFAADPEDSLILHAPLPPDFRAYLEGNGFSLPTIVVHPDFTPDADFTPFGWNAWTGTLNQRYARPARHPDLEAVRKANSRAFSHASESSGDGQSFAALFDSLDAMERHCLASPVAGGWVAKGNHGHAGTANRRIPPGPLEPVLRNALEILFRENGLVALEPWQDRVQDMALNFTVDADGSVGNLRSHETLNSRDGAFLGVKVMPGGQAPEPWRKALGDAASRLGRALAAIGYSGPVGMDAYTWRDAEGSIRLRAPVDINARLSMALPAHGLARRIPDRILLWTWAKPKKLVLPGDYAALGLALGDAGYDPSTRAGILAVSPLRVTAAQAKDPTKPKRVGFAFVARDEEELLRLRAAFRQTLGRP